MKRQYKLGPKFKKMSGEEAQALIDKFAEALFDLVDGQQPPDLVAQTGLSEDKCQNIYDTAYEWWNNS